MGMVSRKTPRTMSTQHPDNVSSPSWVSGEVIQGEDEVHEAYFAYSQLGCMEVMWDAEGKDVDTRVIRKLLSKYGDFFREHVIGEDIFLTYRVPNPNIESVERKILFESLVNIPVAYDIASTFYGREVAPFFEVILPLTTCAEDLLRLKGFYERAIAGIGDVRICGDTRVSDWVGEFKPKSIEVIPLIEDMKSMLNVDCIIKPYISMVRPKYLRVFLARSDPALNYGLTCAVILCKLALSRLRKIEEDTGVEIYPIIGAGTMPFRGHLNPDNIHNFLDEYRGVHTVTIQSAMKYDYPIELVKESIRILNERLPCGEPRPIEPHEEELLRRILAKFARGYQRTIEPLAPLINYVARYVPPRRARKLQIGLFGYSRSVGRVSLPRAIPFAAALYTLGIPPEFIGFKALLDLSEEEWDALRENYRNLEHDLAVAAGFLSWSNINMLAEMCDQLAGLAGMSVEELRSAIGEIIMDLSVVEEKLGIKAGPRTLTQRRYENAVNDFLAALLEQEHEEARRRLIDAARIRCCLG